VEILTLQKQDLVQRLKQVATDENTTAEALLDAAVGEFLDKWVSQKIQTETSAFANLHPQLVGRHLGEYVAIHNSQVVDHDINMRALHLRIRHRFGRMPVLIRQVTQSAEARDLVFRSPKLESLPI